MKAGDIFYNHDRAVGSRGQVTELLCYAIDVVLGPDNTTRFSNGIVMDTLYRMLDLTCTTKEQKKKLKYFLANPEEDY